MGTMGPGIFDNDAALDILDDVQRVPMKEIEAFLASTRVGPEDIDCVLACIAIHSALITGCGAPRPSAKLALELKDKLLRLFDDEYEQLKPRPDHQAARRKVLAAALDHYHALSA